MKWHPDKNKDNRQEAERKFKEISEAYQILSDENKRNSYNMGGNMDFSNMNFMKPEDLFKNDDFLKKFFNEINKDIYAEGLISSFNFSSGFKRSPNSSFMSSSSSSQTIINNGKVREIITTTQNGITKQIIKENGKIISEKQIKNI